MEPGEIKTWIKELIRRSHGSPLEHSTYTFEIECSRVCSHQLVRHRFASYTQQSMRYSEGFLRKTVLELCKKLEVDCPSKPLKKEDYRVYSEIAKIAVQSLQLEELAEALSIGFVYNPRWSYKIIEKYNDIYANSLSSYYSLLADDLHREDARYLVPAAVRTRIVATMNARELVESFLPLRMCTRAQWEIRLLAWRIREELLRVHPEIFSYSGPRCLLEENRVRWDPVTLEEYASGSVEPAIERCPELVPRNGIPRCIRYANYTNSY